MKNILIHFIYSVTIIILIVSSVISFHNNNVLESRINSLYKNGKDFSSEKTFKEDYYIKQQSGDTTLLLVVFPIIVGFISLFTFANIVQKIRATKAEIDNDIQKKETEWNEQHKRLIDLEIDLKFQIANNCIDKSREAATENNFEQSLMLSLAAMEKYAQIINLSTNQQYKESVYETLRLVVDYDYSLLGNNNSIFDISNPSFEVYNKRIITILGVLNKEDSIKFSSVISRYRFS